MSGDEKGGRALKFYKNSPLEESGQSKVYGMQSLRRDLEGLEDTRGQQCYMTPNSALWDQTHKKYYLLDREKGNRDFKTLEEYDKDFETRSIENLLKHIVGIHKNGNRHEAYYVPEDAGRIAAEVHQLRVYFYHRNYLILDDHIGHFGEIRDREISIGEKWMDLIINLCKSLRDGYRRQRPDILEAREAHVKAIRRIKDCFRHPLLLHVDSASVQTRTIDVLRSIINSIEDDINTLNGLRGRAACDHVLSDDTLFAALTLAPRVSAWTPTEKDGVEEKVEEDEMVSQSDIEVNDSTTEGSRLDDSEGFTAVGTRNNESVINSTEGMRFTWQRKDNGRLTYKRFSIPNPLDVSHTDIFNRAIDSLGGSLRSILLLGASMPPDLCSTRRIHPAYFISKCFLNFFVPEKNRNIKRMETHQNNNWGVPMFMLEKRGSRTIPYWPNANNSTRVTLREHGILQVGRDIGILEELQPPTNSPEDWRQWWDEWFANNSHRVDCERLLKAHPFANDCRFVLKFLRDHLELLEPNHKLRSTSGEYAELRTKFTRQFDEDGSLGALEELCGTVRDFIDNKLLPLADCLR